jgi:hypothetical protein
MVRRSCHTSNASMAPFIKKAWFFLDQKGFDVARLRLTELGRHVIEGGLNGHCTTAWVRCETPLRLISTAPTEDP